MTDKVTVVPYDAAWPGSFALLAGNLRTAMGDVAVRIDHIGSTAVPGLSAKPVIDIQVSVRSLEPRDAHQRAIESCGFVLRMHNPDRTKRYFREAPGARRTHVHVRSAGSWSEQFSLLFRDFLRLHRTNAMDYERGKVTLAQKYENDRKAYTAHKAPLISAIMTRADQWSQDTGWTPRPSDA